MHVKLASGGTIDVVPHKFLHGGHRSLPTKRFKDNSTGQQAVRLAKKHAEVNELGWKGEGLERLVLQYQQTHPGANTSDILEHMLVGCSPSGPARPGRQGRGSDPPAAPSPGGEAAAAARGAL